MAIKEAKETWDRRSDRCGDNREGCQELICKKIDGMKKNIDKIEGNISDIKDASAKYQLDMAKTLMKISEHIGATKMFMDNYKIQAIKVLIPGHDLQNQEKI